MRKAMKGRIRESCQDFALSDVGDLGFATMGMWRLFMLWLWLLA